MMPPVIIIPGIRPVIEGSVFSPGAPINIIDKAKPRKIDSSDISECNLNFLLVSCVVVKETPAASDCLNSAIGAPHWGQATALVET
tara:strand:+ start:717 stop:974 length:258 start_codon:yes stop_codon:yes gene_type:complete